MDCKTVRRLIDEGKRDSQLASHLKECPACRAEAAFAKQVAAAIGAFPRLPAPDGLAERVMATLRSSSSSVRLPVRRPPLALRPWEIGWLGASCLFLLIFARMALGSWTASAANFLTSWVPTWTIVLRTGSGHGSTLREWWSGITRGAADAGQYLPFWSGAPAAWLWGAVGFAVALFLLLSWREGSGGARNWEDTHA